MASFEAEAFGVLYGLPIEGKKTYLVPGGPPASNVCRYVNVMSEYFRCVNILQNGVKQPQSVQPAYVRNSSLQCRHTRRFLKHTGRLPVYHSEEAREKIYCMAELPSDSHDDPVNQSPKIEDHTPACR